MPDNKKFLERLNEKDQIPVDQEILQSQDLIPTQGLVNLLKSTGEKISNDAQINKKLGTELRAKSYAQKTGKNIQDVLNDPDFLKQETRFIEPNNQNVVRAMQEYSQPIENKSFNEILNKYQKENPEATISPYLKAGISKLLLNQHIQDQKDKLEKVRAASKINNPNKQISEEESIKDPENWQTAELLSEAENAGQVGSSIKQLTRQAAMKALEKLAQNKSEAFNQLYKEYGPNIQKSLAGHMYLESQGIDPITKNISRNKIEQIVNDNPFLKGETSPKTQLVLPSDKELKQYGAVGLYDPNTQNIKVGLPTDEVIQKNPNMLEKTFGVLGHENQHHIEEIKMPNQSGFNYYDPKNPEILKHFSPREQQSLNNFLQEVESGKFDNLLPKSQDPAKLDIDVARTNLIQNYVQNLIENKNLNPYEKLTSTTGGHFINYPGNYELDAATGLYTGKTNFNELFPNLSKKLKK